MVVLRSKLLQTCTRAVEEKVFGFKKVSSVVFSGEDSADLGWPRREFFRLLIQAVYGKSLGYLKVTHTSLYSAMTIQ